MGKYYDTLVNDTTTLVSKHRGVANNQCLSCHEATLPQMLHEIQMTVTGTYELPLKKVEFTNDFCLQSGCHLAAGVMPGATESSRLTGRSTRTARNTAYSSATAAI